MSETQPPQRLTPSPRVKPRPRDGQLIFVDFLSGRELGAADPAELEILRALYSAGGDVSQAGVVLNGRRQAAEIDAVCASLVARGILLRSGSSIQYPIEEYQALLLNTNRMLPYFTALSSIVKRDDLVIEVGSGLGLFGLFSARLGARVICVEPGISVELSRQIAADNGLGDRMEFASCEIDDFVLSGPRADVVVSEFIGDAIFEEGIERFSQTACEKLLKPGGHLLPSQLDAYVVGVESDELRQRVDAQQHQRSSAGELCGFDLRALDSPMMHLAAGRLLRTSGWPGDQLQGRDINVITEPATLRSVNLLAAPEADAYGRVELKCIRDGRLDAFFVAFRARLADGIWLDNGIQRLPQRSWPPLWVPNLQPRFLSARPPTRVHLDWASVSDLGFHGGSFESIVLCVAE